MELADALIRIGKWAAKIPEVERADIFGSRAKGNQKPHSDIDIALRLRPGLDESGGLATWLLKQDEWQKELDELLPWDVDLEWNGGSETPIVSAAISEASLKA